MGFGRVAEMPKSLGTMIVALLAFVLAGCAPAAAPGDSASLAMGDAGTVYVIRHLQKAEGDDPPLTDEGSAGAVRLAMMLEDAGIGAIYSTQTRRTMETAVPLASALGLAITPYDPRDPQALVNTVRAQGGSVLVVGHSNTVPDIVARFGGQPVPQLTESDYGTVFAVGADGAVRSIEVE